ncbi:MAG: ABC-2 type transport system ATP-binding protein [Gammaproteobacteria bacterium]|jgi:ABC-2 type transport system ATP-binding protein
MESALTLSNVSCRISGTDILNSINLKIPQGSYFALAGVNGAGKSTLIKLSVDLIRLSEPGQINILGRSHLEPTVRNNFVYLPENFSVKKAVTGWQYLTFFSSIYHRDIEEDSINNLAEKLDFDPARLNSKTATYSKGMIQKLGLISCFMLERKLMIFDEPLSGLDPRARFHFKQLLIEEKLKGTTVFYSTHMLADAEEICDQFGILHEKEIRYAGSPEQCKQLTGTETLERAYMQTISE